MYRNVQLVLGGLLALVFGLSALSRRFPHVAWLQVFRYDPPRLSKAQRARIRRRSNIHAGIEMILMGMALPLLYVASTVMLFNDFATGWTVLVLAGSLLLIGLGITAIWKNRRS
jgi:sterol desaturase/sphingolipid hydroxylase (fatty acid hydroxylase superfamily)